MKKIFTLLTLLLCAIGMQAADETLFSANPTAAWSVPASTTDAEITSSYANITGGKMYVTNEQTGAKDLIKKQGELAFQQTNNNTFFKVVLNKALQAGDVISARMQSRTDADLGLWFSTATSRPGTEPTSKIVLATASSSAWVEAPTYTVAEGDGICGETTFYIYRGTGKSTYFNTFTITRPSSAPELAAAPTSLSFSLNPSTASETKAFTLTGSNLTAGETVNIAAATTVEGLSISPTSVIVGEDGTINQEVNITYAATGDIAEATVNVVATAAASAATITVPVTYSCTSSSTYTIGYTEAINGTKLEARELTGCDNVTISEPVFGSSISNYKETSKSVFIDNTAFANTDSWRKSGSDYDNQNVGYTLTVASGYKMNIQKINARIAVADDTYTWYVEILNGAGTQIWKSGEITTTKASSGKIDNVDVSTDPNVQGLTGNVTVNLWVKQGGSTKYFSINYLQMNVTTEVDNRPTYAMSVSANDETMGTFTPADGSEVTEGESVAFTATPNNGYKFVKWVIDGEEQNANPYTIENVTEAHTAVAYFAKRYMVTYDIDSYKNSCTKILNNVDETKGYDEVYSNNEDNYTIPSYADKYLYSKGKTFKEWQDADGNTYASGATIAMTKDITLTPTFTTTKNTISDATEETVVTWTFAKADILYASWQGSNAVGYNVAKVAVNGETISVPMIIDATNGKVDNSGRTDAIAQVNQNTKFTIPAVSGMVVKIVDAYKNISTTTIAGSTDYQGTGTKSVSYTYTGSEETIDIIVNESGQYLNTIKVTYPGNTVSVTIPESGYATLTTAYALDFSSTEVKAYKATAVNESSVTIEEVSQVPANGSVIIGGAAGTYSIPVATETVAALEGNLMAGSATEETTLEAYAGYILSGGMFHPCTAGKLAVGKAYLAVSAANSKALNIVFGEGTGINNVNVNENDNESGKIFNLAGQQMKSAVKGVYIKNGKKYVK